MKFCWYILGTSSFQSCVCSLGYEHSPVASIKFPTAQIFVVVHAYAFTQNVRTSVLFALSGWFFRKWCDKFWATCCFFYFFDSRRSRLVMGFVSLLKTQPLYFDILIHNCVQRSFTSAGCCDNFFNIFLKFPIFWRNISLRIFPNITNFWMRIPFNYPYYFNFPATIFFPMNFSFAHFLT